MSKVKERQNKLLQLGAEEEREEQERHHERHQER
jgi:hypothetical protein